MATYTVSKMRAVKPSNKMAEKHPDRFLTVFGTFFNDQGAQLSITSKVITRDDVLDPDFSIDLTNGILTLPEGQRGRRANPSLSEDDLLAELNAIRNAD